LPTRWPAIRGSLFALTAAVLFGISTPLVQHFGVGVGAFATAALLYGGAAAVGALLRRRVEHEARVVSGDVPRLLAMAAVGAIIGPVALAWGLQRTSGTSASLMLTLEALFTAVLAWRLYRETMGRRVRTAMLLLLAGGILLVLDQGATVVDSGVAGRPLATAAWAGQHLVARPRGATKPGGHAKAVLGARDLDSGGQQSLPSPGAALGLFTIGATGYGLSLRFYLLAQRAFGAARTGSVFAFAPFIGAGLAVALGDHSTGWVMAAGSVLMLSGVVLHLVESHGHEHEHEVMEHEHAHRHDDGHHEHVHDPMPADAHSHRHRHEPLWHAHPHVPDAHHAHPH
jgi:drug/metabolite transporter (DMT)-like permease